MKFSRYNYLKYSERFGYLLFNTRTKYFLSLSQELFHKLDKLSKLKNIEKGISDLAPEIWSQLVNGKVIVGNNEDDDFYELKKYLRYKQAFSCNSIGLVVVPTFACNFKCPYCYEDNLPNITMKTEVVEAIYSFIKKLKQNNVDLCWHGGEPLLAFDSIVSFLNKIGNDCDIVLRSHSMVSNGFLLDKTKCQILNEFHLGRIQITIDGNKDYHDKSRIHKAGIPTYDTIIQNVENVFQYIPDCQVIIRINLHNENKDSFPALYKDLKRKWHAQKFIFNISFVNDVNASCKIACLADKGKISYIRSLYELYGIKDISLSVQPQIGGCTASCVNSYVIGPLGEIYKCWADVGLKGKIVSDIFNGKLSNYLLPSYTVGSDMFSDEKCKMCAFMPMCDGGCIVRRFNQKHYQTSYEPCPIDEEGILSLMELYYMKKNE